MIKKPTNFQIRKNASFKATPNINLVLIQDSKSNIQKPSTSNERIDSLPKKITHRTESEPGSDNPSKITRRINSQVLKLKSPENIHVLGKN